MVGGAHLFVEELLEDRRQPRRRRPRPRPDPGAAGDRAAGEGQQLLLGARRQGRAGARQHQRRDGLPVDDPDRDRPDLHRLGPERHRDPLDRASASPAACSPTRACTWRSRFKPPAIAAWFVLYAAFIVVVVVDGLSGAGATRSARRAP